MTPPKRLRRLPPRGLPQWTGKAGSTGPLGLTGSCVAGGASHHGELA
jgi:hypothetical protein